MKPRITCDIWLFRGLYVCMKVHQQSFLHKFFLSKEDDTYNSYYNT